ncbi:phage holin [Staphylococcus felis]|uniref:phage holin n=1 Tax=Staphylococcus felis TaxID=46127 RepID=UPI000E24AF7E|nr:phage holin [Staphylococcus felis]MCE5541747.1 phage holin [Staphylococcus pseudintermedius]REI11016.1 phage holin [Staphylococcus felis]
MKINWKLRFKNKAVLTGLLSAVLLFVKQVTEIFGIDLSTQLEQVSGVVGAVLMLLTGLGILIDPTTQGVSDTGIAHTYDEPRDQYRDPVVFKGADNTRAPETFDTSQPFTDDSDDVVFDVNQYDANEKERGL